jgi:hypothetical protein
LDACSLIVRPGGGLQRSGRCDLRYLGGITAFSVATPRARQRVCKGFAATGIGALSARKIMKMGLFGPEDGFKYERHSKSIFHYLFH